MSTFKKILNNQSVRSLASAVMVTSVIFYTFAFVIQANAAAVTLTATVSTSLTFNVSSNQFGTITPGTWSTATTTLDVLTNDTNGYFVTLSGDYKVTGQNNLQLVGATSTQITDQTEWIPGASTSTAGNSVVRASLNNSGNVLAFRVMTASSTNGTSFYAPTWWGATDADGTAKWAGISSSTVQRQIGNAGTGSYSASNHYNTVQYYLQVSASQPTGSYSAPLTYTATGN